MLHLEVERERMIMKKVWMLLVVLSIGQLACAIADIGYSNNGGGFWMYTPSAVEGEGVFSFTQPIVIDNVLGDDEDALVGASLYIPNLAVSDLVFFSSTSGVGDIYTGSVAPASSAVVVLKDAGGNDILTGVLAGSGVFTVGSTALMYSEFAFDIVITALPNAVNSDFISSLNVGWGFDFSLTLQDTSLDLANMILTNLPVPQGGTLSGDMITIVPEPATMILLGLGAILLRKRIR